METMPEDSDAFKGGTGVWSKAQWLGWTRWVGEQLNPPTVPSPTRPTPVIN